MNSAISNLAENPRPSIPGPALSTGAPKSRASVWVRRIYLVLFVLVCLEVGMMLLVLPWTRVWTDNSLLIRNVSLRAFALHGFVRGAVSGLGLIDLWMGIWEGVHYRESRK